MIIKTKPLPILALGLACSGFAANLAASLPQMQSKEWAFAVYLDDKRIGDHAFTLQPEGDTLKLYTEASFDVKFLFFTAYSYRHRNTERWDEAGLVSISAYTDANGDIYDIRGERREDEFVVDSGSGQEVLPAPLKTFAYWNPKILNESSLLNSQTGEYEAVTVVERGEDMVEFRESRIPARRYDLVLESGLSISIWYAVEDNTWVALESLTESGRILRYLPVRLPVSPVELPSLIEG